MDGTLAEKAEQLLPLADALFADTQQYAREMFGQRLPDGALSPQLLLGWGDHAQPWVQALGRQRLAPPMSAPAAHPSPPPPAPPPPPPPQRFATQRRPAPPPQPPPRPPPPP